MSLGFNCVAHETAETINCVTRNHVNELASLNATVSDSKIQPKEQYVKNSLEKIYDE